MTALPPLPTPQKLGLVIDLDTCVGCHACVVSCKGWNTQSATGAPLSDQNAYEKAGTGTYLNRVHTFEVVPHPAAGEVVPHPPAGEVVPHPLAGEVVPDTPAGNGAGVPLAASSLAQITHFPKSCLHCEEAPCVTVCPTGASYKRADDGIVLVNEDACIGCGLCAWACPYGAREKDMAAQVMKKCTLCVDRIYNENLEPEDRQPACVRTCPASARHFGDLGDPDSDVSILVRERGGFDLMPEQGTKPVNKYLPPRPKQDGTRRDAAAISDEAFDIFDLVAPAPEMEQPSGFLGWLDRTLEKANGAGGTGATK